MRLEQQVTITKLQKAIEQLEQADVLVQEALGATDVCEDTHNRIQDIIYDLQSDIDSISAAENFMYGG
jgi:hypothetical protein